MIIDRNCDVCKNEYKADTRYLNRGQGKTCSRPCGTILSSRVRSVKSASKRIPNTTCAYCSAALYRKPSLLARTSQSFCDSVCQNEAAKDPNNTYKPGPKGTGRKRPSIGNCTICERPSTVGIHVKCQQRQDNISKWIAGDNSATLYHNPSTGHPVDTKGFVKKYLLETRGDACETCGFDKKTPDGRSIIQMDHVNGNCFDNSLDNLKLLCPNCHAMTPTYGSLNSGSGRAHRRKGGK